MNQQLVVIRQQEIDQFGRALQQVESMLQDASIPLIQKSLSNNKLLHDDQEFAAFKLQVLERNSSKAF
ncbi:unnamed protein product [Paramecium octaurelia]|uniref:Uncharacterized protein n=1 Tax=Paramecium octaurelia TaxID=43137 RepID=A0A8S1T7F0_PAROT|nr:unnamed protein product [Paramecium octaurelia]